jgi:hypothetical protein
MENKKILLYRLTLNEELLDMEDKEFGTKFIATTLVPATDMLFAQFANQDLTEQQVQFRAIENKDKRRLISVVLQPEQIILRKPSEKVPQPHAFIMDKNTVELTASYFMKKGYANNIIHEHDKDSKVNAWVTQSWIVDDPKFDKTSKFFNNVKEGSWADVTYFKDEKYWNDYVVTGKVKGFSIDGSYGAFLDSIIDLEYNSQTVSNGEIEIIKQVSDEELLLNIAREILKSC